MRPRVWNPPISLSAQEEKVAKRIRKAKLFVFLRQIRHELFDSEFQTELATVFKDSNVGLCPVPPAQLALFNHSTSIHRGFRRGGNGSYRNG